MTRLEINKDGLTLDGKDFYLACGDIQYFRIYPDEWKRRLEILRDFGLTAVQTYCPWNLHEPSEGIFDFEGILDLAKFLETCAEAGLKVLLRPSPYICGEWDFGGLPWWLLKDRHMRYRCAHKPFLDKLDAYYKRLCKEFLPYLSTKGGPIIAVCIENEYGSFGSDLDYLGHLKDTLSENGVDVPFYQTDCTAQGIGFTKPLGTWQATNYRIESDRAVPALKKIQPDMPPFVGEYWSGRSVYWGESGAPREVAPIAAAYRTALELGAYVSFYMFAGGTNFGFMNGSRVTKSFGGGGEMRFRAITTSYDCDALLSEDGNPSEKYYACRRELDGYLGKPIRTERLAPAEMQSCRCELTETALLFGNLEYLGASVSSAEPLTFEELDCPYGFVLYSVTLPSGYDAELPLKLEQVRDNALIFVDGERRGVIRRGFPEPEIKIRADKPHRLDILVENLGRTNTRPEFVEEKGILGEVKLGISRVYGFECRGLTRLSPISGAPFTLELSGLRFGSEPSTEPRFLRGSFAARAGIPTNLHIKGLGSGFAVVNGMNIGRYRSVGPQETLYVPGGILRDGENELILFELTETPVRTVEFISRSILSGSFISDD